jgi:aspartate/methionine/tyrosine aminotransferase
MDITNFNLEKWYVKYEFSSKYNLSASGITPLSLKELEIEKDFWDTPLGYSPVRGNSELLEALANIYSVSPEEIMVTNGAIEAIFLAQMALLDKGDKVITVKPVYPALYQIAQDIGAEIIEWKLEFSEAFQPDTEKLEKLLQIHQPKMLIINFPHNPTGKSLSEKQLSEICFLAEKYNCLLLSDEIYKDLSYAQPVKNACQLLPESAISISSLSKSYGLPGLRIGWMVCNRDIISKCANLRHYTSLCNNLTGEIFATSALKNYEIITKNSVEHARGNFKILQSRLEKWRLEFAIDYIEPDSGVMVFVKMNNFNDTEQFCIDFENKTSILLLPGNKYGAEYARFFRLGFGGKTDELIYCLEKLEIFLQK